MEVLRVDEMGGELVVWFEGERGEGRLHFLVDDFFHFLFLPLLSSSLLLPSISHLLVQNFLNPLQTCRRSAALPLLLLLRRTVHLDLASSSRI